MKKILIIAAVLIGSASAKGQCGTGIFPTIDSLQRYINIHIRNSAINSFTNLRLNTAMIGITQWLDCLESGGGGTDNANVGAAYRLLDELTQQVKTLTPGYGILIDSALSGRLRFAVDTASMPKTVFVDSSGITIRYGAPSAPGVPDTLVFSSTGGGGGLDGTGTASYFPFWSDANTLNGTSPVYKSSNNNVLINTTTEYNNYSRLQIAGQKMIFGNPGSTEPPEFEFWGYRDSSGVIVPKMPKMRLGYWGTREANIGINMNYKNQDHMPDATAYGATWVALEPDLGVAIQHYKANLPSYASDPWFAYGGLLMNLTPVYSGDNTIGGLMSLLRLKIINQSSPGTNDATITNSSAVLDFNNGGGFYNFDGPIRTGSFASDPSGSNGRFYYNTATNKFKAYENGAWVNMIGAGGGSESTTASNGLTLSGVDVRLGGTLTQNTDFTQAGFRLSTDEQLLIGTTTAALSGSKLEILATTGNTEFFHRNEQANTNGNKYSFRKTVGGGTPYTLTQGTNVGYFNYNTVSEFGGVSNANALSNISLVDFYWNAYNSAGTQRDLMKLFAEDGQLRLGTTTAQISASSLMEYWKTGGQTWVTLANKDVNTNYNRIYVVKNHADDWDAPASGDKAFAIETNTLITYEHRFNADATGGFRALDHVWTGTNSGGTTAERMRLTGGGLLTVNTLKITGGSPGAGKVLTSDADGDGTWETPTEPNIPGAASYSLSADKTFSASATAEVIPLDTEDFEYNLTHSTSSSNDEITFVTAGLYTINAYTNIATAGTSASVKVCVQKWNGSTWDNVTNSTSLIRIPSSGGGIGGGPLNISIYMAASDKIRFVASCTNSTDDRLDFIAAADGVAAIPGFRVTITGAKVPPP
jgi:hypothetical protein